MPRTRRICPTEVGSVAPVIREFRRAIVADIGIVKNNSCPRPEVVLALAAAAACATEGVVINLKTVSPLESAGIRPMVLDIRAHHRVVPKNYYLRSKLCILIFLPMSTQPFLLTCWESYHEKPPRIGVTILCRGIE